VSEIKQEIKGLGDINLSSIDEYKSVFERHSELATSVTICTTPSGI
jgi:chromosome segregation ATPase